MSEHTRQENNNNNKKQHENSIEYVSSQCFYQNGVLLKIHNDTPLRKKYEENK